MNQFRKELLKATYLEKISKEIPSESPERFLEKSLIKFRE